MNVGLLGYGFFGRKVARAIARVANLSMIADPHHGNMNDAMNDWGRWGTDVVSGHSLVLRNCDAVWIATPVPTHGALVAEAIEANIHVMCEKPFVLDADEAVRLANLAQAADVALMVGHLSLYTPEHDTIKGFAANARSMDLVRWNTQSSLSDSTVLWGLGPHDVATVLDCWGGEPDKVECIGTTHRAIAWLTWGDEDPLVADLDLDWLALKRWRMIAVDGVDIIDSLSETPEPRAKEPLLAEAEAFIEVCRNREGRLAKANEAVAVTRTLHRLHKAMT